MKIDNIVFHYPSKILGGAELLFIRVAKHLADTTDYRVFFVDYSDGFPHKQLSGSKVKTIDYCPNAVTEIPDNSIVIQQLNLITRFGSTFICSGEYRILYWGIHPENLTSQIYFKSFCLMSKRKKKQVGVNLYKLSSLGVIRYMDSINLKANSLAFKFPMEEHPFIPVPIDDARLIEKPKSHFINENEVHIAWVGRLSPDKYMTLITLMNEMDDVKSNRELILHIVGDGPMRSEVEKASMGRNYNISFEGTIDDSKLDNFIDNVTDIGFAMGTSNLEFAKRGVPAILRGVSHSIHKSGECNDYVITSEIKGFSLGGTEVYKMEVPEQDKFRSKLDLIVNEYPIIAKDCYEYVARYHSLDNTCSRLIENVHIQENLDFREVIGCIERIKRRFYISKRIQKCIGKLSVVKHRLSTFAQLNLIV